MNHSYEITRDVCGMAVTIPLTQAEIAEATEVWFAKRLEHKLGNVINDDPELRHRLYGFLCKINAHDASGSSLKDDLLKRTDFVEWFINSFMIDYDGAQLLEAWLDEKDGEEE